MAKKIQIEFDISTIFTDYKTQLGKFKTAYQNALNSGQVGKTSKGVYGELSKEMTSFESQLKSLESFKLDNTNVEKFDFKVKSLGDTLEKINSLQSEIANNEKIDSNQRISDLNELITKQKEQLVNVQLTRAQLSNRVSKAEEKVTNYSGDKRTKEYKALQASLEKAKIAYKANGDEIKSLNTEIAKNGNELINQQNQLNKQSNTQKAATVVVEKAIVAQQELNDQVSKNVEEQAKIRQEETQNVIGQQVKQWTSLAVAVRFARQQLIKMKDTYLELDNSLTQIAVVSGKTRDQMWGMIGTYNEMAQRLGVTTKDVVESSKLYFQQGRSQSEVMKLVEQTTILATISELDFTSATNFMTAAINGFKLSADDAVMVTDTWANLAAQAAVDTDELATAISKVASISQSAGMDINSTSAFLTKMINLIMLTRA